jgi:uncharacterized protein
VHLALNVRVLVGIVVVVVAGYLVIALLLWRFQERIVFQPPAWRDRTPIPAAVTAVEVVAPDGNRGKGYEVGQLTARPPILFFHGNAEIARWRIPWAITAAERTGTRVYLAEYRGYDGGEGSPTYEGVKRDAEAILTAAAQRCGVAENGFVLYGHSLGSAIAAELATSKGCTALLLEAPFTSAREMVARWPVVGIRLGWSLVSRVHYDTVARVRGLNSPVSVVHGERDVVIPPRMGKAVYAAAAVKGELLIVARAGHSDIPEVAGGEYWAWLNAAVGEQP